MGGRTQLLLSDKTGSSSLGSLGLLLAVGMFAGITFLHLGEGFDGTVAGLSQSGSADIEMGTAALAGSDEPAPKELDEPVVHIETQPGVPEPETPPAPTPMDRSDADGSDLAPFSASTTSTGGKRLERQARVADLLLDVGKGIGGQQPTTLVESRQATSRKASSGSRGSKSDESPWKLSDRGIRSLHDVNTMLGTYYDQVVTKLWGSRYSGWNDPEFLRSLVKYGSQQAEAAEEDALRLAALLELTKVESCSGFWCRFMSTHERLRPVDSESCSLAGLGDACEKLVTDLARVPALAVQGENDVTAMSPRDIKQGEAQNCYLLASLGALTLADQHRLKRLIKDNGDGTFTVTFHDFDPETRLVDGTTQITVRPDGGRADVGDTLGEYRGALPVWLAEELRPQVEEVWVQVIEQAYAEWLGGYYRIENRGYVQDALLALTGSAETVGFAGCNERECFHSNLQDIGQLFDAYSTMQINDREHGFARLLEWKRQGRPIAVASIHSMSEHQAQIVDQNSIITGHAYYVESVNAETVVLRNPYGWDPSPYNSRQGRIELSREDFLAVFSDASAGPIPSEVVSAQPRSGGSGRVSYR